MNKQVMADKEPTQAQIKEFWKWCGFFKVDYVDTMPYRFPTDKGHECYFGLPELNLNNLFKYAVPKLQDNGNNVELHAYEHKGYAATVFKDGFSQRGSDGYEPFLEPISQVKNDDPALALFWAIWEVMHSA